MIYLNDNAKESYAWLKELMADGLIPQGFIDIRSIADVMPTDLEPYKQCHFFAGIGGWLEALRIVGWHSQLPVWSGSCPCQPFSVAGRQQAEADDRDLWPEFKRLIDQCKPAIVFGEQVASELGRRWLIRVRADLEKLGYAVGCADLCAAGVGAPHVRQRLYWGAIRLEDATRFRWRRWCDADTQGHGGPLQVEGRCSPSGLADPPRRQRKQRGGPQGYDVRVPSEHSDATNRVGDVQQSRLERHPRHGGVGDEPRRQSASARRPTAPTSFWADAAPIRCRHGEFRRVPTEPFLFPVAHGLQGRVGLLRGAGNAIVPQLAAEFIRSFMQGFVDLLDASGADEQDNTD